MCGYIAPYTNTKQEYSDGEALLIDNGQNAMFCFDAKYTLNGINQDITNTKHRVAIGTVKKLYKFQLSEQYKDNYMYLFECTPANHPNETQFIEISEREFGTSAMVRKLRSEGGIVFCGKQSDGKAAKLIANWLIACGNVEEKYVPYHSGWENGIYHYITSEAHSPDNMDSLYLNSILLIDDDMSIDVAIHNVYNTIKHTKNVNSLMLFMLMIYGMLHTVFSELKLSIKN